MTVASLYDSKRRPIAIGGQIASAGEGKILEVTDGRNLLAKVYHKPTPLKAEKLRFMTQVCNDRLTSLAAWPTDTIHTSGGETIGFLMPRIASAKEIHTLYSPGDRKKHFPDASWAFLVRAATNTARAFAVLHEQGHIVGDVNHGNLLVSGQATVALVDCDSFQVQSPHRNYLCEVGVATHTPPELQDSNFASILRTKNHDAFGLAVLIFQLLFMGRHPFSGGFLGQGEMPIERAIKEFRFAYGDGASTRQMQQPPNTLPLKVVSTSIAFLFERAFSKEGRDSGRPSAGQWISALETLEKELCICSKNNRHLHHKATLCPWCDLESRTGVIYFVAGPARKRTAFPPLISIEVLWKRIEAVALPSIPPENIKVKAVSPAPFFAEIAQKRQSFLWKTFHFVTVLKARNEATARINAAQIKLEALRTAWQLPELHRRFQTTHDQFDEARKAFHALDFERQKRLGELNRQIRDQQMRRHLENCSIRAGIISGIGPAKEMVLKSYGIDTAYDLTADRILQVPGFGPAFATRLLNWRTSMEQSFRFDSSKGVDSRDIDVVDADIYIKRKQIVSYLESAPALLKAIVSEMESEWIRLHKELKEVVTQQTQAKADLEVVS